jgi:5'-nucleotidase
MHILLTNDDGIQAPGLLALSQAMQSLGTVTIIAPNRNWSASGHVKTMHRPLRVRDAKLADGSPAISTDGAPSDCVALALLGLIEEPVDLVLSGINPHANVGYDVTYSGTVTAAMEATIFGIPGIAVSLDSGENNERDLDFNHAAEATAAITRQVAQYGIPRGTLLNINIPYHQRKETVRGVVITRQGKRIYRDALIRRNDPRGRPYYWIGGDSPTGVAEPGTDFWALSEGYVSITPLSLDLTDQDSLTAIEAWELKV